jgi:hypothetical protein
MVKVYRKNRVGDLSTMVRHDGGFAEVSFLSGASYERGTFTTDSEPLQRSIEADQGFALDFGLAPGYPAFEDEPTDEPTDEPDTDEPTDEPTEEVTDEPTDEPTEE